MKILPLSSDSMGTRSMATFVETRDLKILIDPGVALGPYRYGLPPHPLEWRKLEEDWKIIVNHALKADVIVVTHYHYDHHNPWENLEIYEGKLLIIKNPKDNINYSQRERAGFFLKQIEGLPKKIEVAEEFKLSVGETRLEFSKPVFHGTNSKLGYVVEVYIREGDESFLYSSDVEGPSLNDQAEFILENKPKVVMIDGPMTYMLGYRYSVNSLKASIANLRRVLESGVEQMILDHHLLRDLEWRERISDLIVEAERRGVKVLTSAEYAGKELSMLEARRRELYELNPVDRSEIKHWKGEE